MEAQIIDLLGRGDTTQVEALARSHPSEAVAPLMKVLLEEPPFDRPSLRRAFGEIRAGNSVRALRA